MVLHFLCGLYYNKQINPWSSNNHFQSPDCVSERRRKVPQEAFTFERDYINQARLGYLRYLPKTYGSALNQKWPLILFLHGAGERGSDIDLVLKHGIPKIAETLDLPFVTLSPQCPVDHWWSDYMPALDDLLVQAIATLDVDPDQIYLTGISMGGFGTWHMAVEYPERFAAIAPICGGGAWPYSVRQRVCSLKEVPAWVFHGAKDDVVPLWESQVMVDAMKECGGDVRLTVYPEATHDSWTETYNNPELYEWFLTHRKIREARR
jgi:predicted peptidase